MAEREQQRAISPTQGAQHQVMRIDDAAQLPPGAWIGRRDGKLYRAAEGHSLVAVESKEPEEFELLSANPYQSDDDLRVQAARAGVTPSF
jgi:hypothetical protein